MAPSTPSSPTGKPTPSPTACWSPARIRPRRKRRRRPCSSCWPEAADRAAPPQKLLAPALIQCKNDISIVLPTGEHDELTGSTGRTSTGIAGQPARRSAARELAVGRDGDDRQCRWRAGRAG